jgi:serine/threonine protein kinase
MLTHPLIVDFQGKDFLPNGSIADHLPSAKNADMCQLRGDTRIAIIVTGIVLAMRYVHSKGIIHRNLTPTNIFLDWDWIVRIGGFGQSLIANERHSEHFMNSLSLPTGYVAPECYANVWTTKSDVFSFGLILYELLVGEPAFSNELTPYKYLKLVVNEKTRPHIPDSVVPEVRNLIEDCWSDDPNARPSFESILSILEKMKFKMTPKVDSSKVSKFVEGVKLFMGVQGMAIVLGREREAGDDEDEMGIRKTE